MFGLFELYCICLASVLIFYCLLFSISVTLQLDQELYCIRNNISVDIKSSKDSFKFYIHFRLFQIAFDLLTPSQESFVSR